MLHNIAAVQEMIKINYNTTYNKIITDENLMETIQHGDSDYPFHFYYDNLALFDFNCIEWHWHMELEFVYVEEGKVDCCVGAERFTLSEGNGVFINSKMLHRFYSQEGAVIPNFVCLPTFIAPLGSRIYNKYIQPVISSNIGYQVFAPELSWQKEVIDILQAIFRRQERDSVRELFTISLLQELWAVFFENIDSDCMGEQQEQTAYSQVRLQNMMQYVYTNYASQLSLEEIAQSAGLSKSSALKLFQKYLKMSPVNYLIYYRLQRASELLIKTEYKLEIIAHKTGFNNVGYFCRQFKIYYGITPTEYRKNKFRNR